MNLIVSIVFAIILGVILMMLGPIIGGVLAFGILAGCLFRGVSLLNNINKRLNHIVPETDKVKDAYQNYLKEKQVTPEHLIDKDAYLQHLKEKESQTEK
jgi:large-conductance mechanosensitive channel